MTEQLVQITVDGKAIHVTPANTVIQALALSGEPLLDNVGCMGQGVCGSCRCMVRRLGSREVNTQLACETLVEDGMQVSFIDYSTPRRPHVYQIEDVQDSWHVGAQLNGIFPKQSIAVTAAAATAPAPRTSRFSAGLISRRRATF